MVRQEKYQGKCCTLAELASCVGGEAVGDLNAKVCSVDTLQNASSDSLSFYTGPPYQQDLNTTRAGIVILAESARGLFGGNAIVVSDPHLAYARAATLIFPLLKPHPGIADIVSISDDASISADAKIGPGVVIQAGSHIAAGVVIGAQCVVGKNVTIGAGSRLDARVTIYDDVQIGEACHLLAGAVIGSDGFGFARDTGQWLKVPQLGRVVLGNQVHIGANTTIDRGSIGDTILGNGVIVDNLVQIAHNVQIGERTAIAGCAAIAGSTTIGTDCLIAGRAAIVGHLKIGDGVQVNANTLVTKSISEPGIYSSSWPAQPVKKWQKMLARLRR